MTLRHFDTSTLRHFDKLSDRKLSDHKLSDRKQNYYNVFFEKMYIFTDCYRNIEFIE